MARKALGLALCVALLGLAACMPGPRFHKVDAAYAAGEDTLVLDLPFFAQKKATCCGAACLAMVAAYWQGREAGQALNTGVCPEQGFSGGELVDMAEEAGLSAYLFSTDLAGLLAQVKATRPVIVMLEARGTRHYAVCYGFSEKSARVVLADPGRGRVYCSNSEFAQSWRKAKGFALLVVDKNADVTENQYGQRSGHEKK